MNESQKHKLEKLCEKLYNFQPNGYDSEGYPYIDLGGCLAQEDDKAYTWDMVINIENETPYISDIEFKIRTSDLDDSYDIPKPYFLELYNNCMNFIKEIQEIMPLTFVYKTPLIEAIIQGCELETIEYFMDMIDETDQNGDSVIFYAVQSHRPEIIYALVTDDTDLTIKDHLGKTALEYGLSNNNSEIKAYIESIQLKKSLDEDTSPSLSI